MHFNLFLGLSVIKIAPLQKETGVQRRHYRQTLLLTLSTFAQALCTATASKKMPGLIPIPCFINMSLLSLASLVQINFELIKTSGLLHKTVKLLRFSFRKDLKFVTDVEEEIKNVVELANKVMQFIENAFLNTFLQSHLLGYINCFVT